MKLSLAERAEILSKVHTAVHLYFAHWEALPADYDFELAYQTALEAGLATEDRREFAIVCLKLIASLQNGHSAYHDMPVFGEDLGFRVKYVEGQWIVVKSQRDALQRGNIITHMNDQPIEAFYAEHQGIIHASSEFEKRHRFNLFGYVLDTSFTVTLDDGQTHTIERTSLSQDAPALTHKWLKPDQVAYMHIPRFFPNTYEDEAIELVHQYKDASKLIIDLRGNQGGTTPVRLMDMLMDRPYQGRSVLTPIRFGIFGVYSELAEMFKDQIDKDTLTSLEAYDAFRQGSFMWRDKPSLPETTVFTNQLILLTDGWTVSAGEDFAGPFKTNGRATILGERTMGTSGQPYMADYENGIKIRISAKREYFPNGGPFEGVGIEPDIAITPTLEGIQNENDAVLEAALNY